MRPPGIAVVAQEQAPETPLGDAGAQRILLGAPRGDASPILLGISRVRPGRTGPLIVHETAEVGYVVSGAGEMLTTTGAHPFGPGDAILIEAGCWHAVRAGAAEEVVMVYAFPTSDLPPTRFWSDC